MLNRTDIVTILFAIISPIMMIYGFGSHIACGIMGAIIYYRAMITR